MNSYNRFKKWFKLGFLVVLIVGLSACSSLRGSNGTSSGKLDPNNIPDAVPKNEPLSKYGNPKSYVVHGKRYYVIQNAKGYDKVGLASWYGTKFHGHHTSNREAYDMYSMTAASPVLPIPSYVKVTNLKNGATAIVKVNDRGPFHSNRILDLSYAAAIKLGYANKGTANVRVTVIDTSSPSPSQFFAQNDIAPISSPAAVDESKTDVSLSKKAVTVQPIRLASVERNKATLYIQVGSFKTLNNAQTMSKKIKQITTLNQTQVAIKEGTSNSLSSHVYRVHIGPLKNSDQSKQMTLLLAKNGFQTVKVVMG